MDEALQQAVEATLAAGYRDPRKNARGSEAVQALLVWDGLRRVAQEIHNQPTTDVAAIVEALRDHITATYRSR